ncbi:hypothetical protein EJ03DRAFT_121684 [Teratosphaeria nubilosa]|uniref:Uncharacterized protein n=1 Tax=Teratosphaeria nubilosa TaxID=161662 RepID=A0A6G1L670_9PEZI|nr:hypothetical protein EJ03DRAFT_121684 [Teratosphaeria nubilosa]
MSDSNKRRGYDKRSQDKARVATDGERPSLDTYRPRVQGLTEAFRNANLNSTSLGEVSTSPPGAAAFTGRATERSDPTPFTTPSRSNDRDGAAVYRQAHPGYVTYSGEDPRTGVKTTYQIQVSRNASGSSSRKRNKPLKHVSDRGSDPTRLRQNGRML